MIALNGSKKRRDDKKRAIIQTALELFNRCDFNRVTVTEIAEETHVSKVSTYNFFESKDNPRQTIIEGMLDDSAEKIKSLIAKEGNFTGKVEEYIQTRT